MHITDAKQLVFISQHNEREGDFEKYRMKVVTMTSEHEQLWQAETPLLPTGIWTTYMGDRRLQYSMPFPPRPLIVYDPICGILLSPGDKPVLQLFEVNGRLRFNIRLDIEVRTFTAEDRSKVIDRLNQDLVEGSEHRKAIAKAQKESIVFPQTKPYWTNITIDGSGHIWLQVPEHSADRLAAGGGYLYRVISPEGEYLGDTRIPSIGRFIINRGRMLMNYFDCEAELPQLIVYQIEPAIEGFIYP